MSSLAEIEARRHSPELRSFFSNKTVEQRFVLARNISLWTIAVLVIASVVLPIARPENTELLTVWLASRQDVPIAPIVAIIIILFFRKSTGTATKDLIPFQIKSIAALLIGSSLLISWLGHYAVFLDHDFTRDEQMAAFDAAIFSRGDLFSSIPREWRPFSAALNQSFILPIGNHEFWVSSYLPIHAVFRAALGLILDPSFASPFFVLLGGVCLWGISRKLWPHSLETSLVTVLLYIGSSQIIVTGMTTFAMSMHLGLNLLWLWLFLQKRKQAHVAAVVVGFFATGIHQPLFHPLFVAPFLLQLGRERRWRLLTYYLATYAAIGLFWLAWPIWISGHGSVLVQGPEIGFDQRVLAILKPFTLTSMWFTVANLLRLICWQHPLLIPLASFGLICFWRAEPLVRTLAIGFLLPIVVIAILLPWQGHGWGYRYVHPVLGNAILLAGFGWRQIKANGLSFHRPVLITTALSVLVLLPIQAAMARRMVKPQASLHTMLQSAPVDMIVIDTAGVPFGQDLVINNPDVTNRPVRLVASQLEPHDILVLCKRGTLGFVAAPRLSAISSSYGLDAPTEPTTSFTRLRDTARDAHCMVKDF